MLQAERTSTARQRASQFESQDHVASCYQHFSSLAGAALINAWRMRETRPEELLGRNKRFQNIWSMFTFPDNASVLNNNSFMIKWSQTCLNIKMSSSWCQRLQRRKYRKLWYLLLLLRVTTIENMEVLTTGGMESASSSLLQVVEFFITQTLKLFESFCFVD